MQKFLLISHLVDFEKITVNISTIVFEVVSGQFWNLNQDRNKIKIIEKGDLRLLIKKTNCTKHLAVFLQDVCDHGPFSCLT